MTIASEVNRAGPYNGNGVTVVFAYGFRILDAGHLQVIKADADGNETTLALTTDYTVSGVGDAGGGSIATVAAPASGLSITILRNIPFTQETDLENQGAYYAETVEDALDAAAMRDQQIQEQLNRVVKIPASSDDGGGELAAQLAFNINRLAQSADEIDVVASIKSDVEVVAEISGDVALLADVSAVLSGTASAVRMDEKMFTGDGVDTTWTLDREPGVEENVLVWIGGAIQDTADYSVSGVTLTITPAVANGVEIRTLIMTLVTANDVEVMIDQAQELLDQAVAQVSYTYQTKADAQVSAIGPAVRSIEIRGDMSEGDGLGGLFIDTDNGSTDTFTSADGRTWYRVADVSENRLPLDVRRRLGSIFQYGDLVQKKICELNFGFDNGTTDTQIFAGAQNAIQNITLAKVGGEQKIFAMSRPTGGSSNYLITERCRIVQFPYVTDGSVVNNELFTAEINAGHGALLHPIVDGSTLYFLAPISTVASHEGNDSGKGIQRITWNGASTVAGTQYQLLPWVGTDDPLNEFGKGGWGVSSDGKTLFGIFGSVKDNGAYIMGWDLAEIFATAGGDISATVRPKYGPWFSNAGQISENAAIQGITADDKYIYLSIGFAAPFGRHSMVAYTYDGVLVGDRAVPGVAAEYGRTAMLNHPTLGFPNAHEFEGLTFGVDSSELITAELDTWVSVSGTPVVTYDGRNWAIKATGLLDPPWNQSHWVETKKAATAGAYNPATSYAFTGTYTKRTKALYRISERRGEAGEKPIGGGHLFFRGPGAFRVTAGTPDMVFSIGQNWQIKGWSDALGKYYEAISYNGRGLYLADLRDGADNTKQSIWRYSFLPGREYSEFMPAATASPVFRMFGANDSVQPNESEIDRPDSGYAFRTKRAGTDGFAVYQTTVSTEMTAMGGTGLSLCVSADDTTRGVSKFALQPDGNLVAVLRAAANDAAAAALSPAVPVGGLYQASGVVRIRLT